MKQKKGYRQYISFVIALISLSGCAAKSQFPEFAASVNKAILVSQGHGGKSLKSVADRPEEALLENEKLVEADPALEHRVVSSQWMDGAHVVDRVFDQDFNLIEVKLDGSRVWDIAYDEFGKVSKLGPMTIERIDGEDGTRTVTSTVGIVTTRSVYDSRGTKIEYSVSVGGSPLVQANYPSLSATELVLESEESLLSEGPVESIPGKKVIVTPYGVVTRVDMAGKPAAIYKRDKNGRIISMEAPGRHTRDLIYQDGEKLLAVYLNGQQEPAAVYGYALDPRVPDLVKTQEKLIRVVRDRDGSPRLAIDTATGEIVFRRQYGPRGIPKEGGYFTLFPFGYKGGLVDDEVNITHFGVFAYDMSTGRVYEPHDATLEERRPRYVAALSRESTPTAPLCVCGEHIAFAAHKALGSRAWAADVSRGNFPAGSTKCNLFTAERAQAAGAYVPLVNGWSWPYNQIASLADSYPPVAAQWASPDFQILGWEVVNTQQVQPGDVVAEKKPTENATGHVAIVASGAASTISTVNDEYIAESDWGFRPEQAITVRRYSGLDGPGCECPRFASQEPEGTLDQDSSAVTRSRVQSPEASPDTSS